MHSMLEKFERHPLTFGPTPIERLERLSAHLGGAVDIYAKRDDCNSGLAFGGNKLRKLEYIVPDALNSGADTLVTPLNDSFVDFDLLAHLDPKTNKVLGASVYAEMVWNARQLRAQAGLEPIDWVVVRNRVGAQAMHNKKKMAEAVDILSKRIGFRVAPGFSERVIFRELFPRGLTLLDLRDIGVQNLNLSNVAARQELRELVKELRLPGVTVDF